MPKYFDYKTAGNGGFLLVHSDGVDFCPTKIVAEQKLTSAVHLWAAEDLAKAREQMELLTRFVREQ